MNYDRMIKLTDAVENRLTEIALKGTGLVVPDEYIQEVEKLNQSLKRLSGGRNEISLDVNGRPSIWVVFKADETSRLEFLSNGSTNWTPSVANGYHNAFKVSGAIKTIKIGKYPAARVGGVNYAVSLKGLEPAHTLTFDAALTLANAKGGTCHLMTQQEWAFLALYCMRMGFQPRGNNSYGKAYNATELAEAVAVDSNGMATRTKGGTGPLTWRHDGTPFGISDLNGNVCEWVGGYRTVDGEIQVSVDNNMAVNGADQSAASSLWKAILASDGSLVAPGTTGTLKYDFVSTPADGGAFEITNAIVNSSDKYGAIGFSSMTTHNGVTVPAIAKELLLAPIASFAPGGTQYMRNQGERLANCGGYWSYTSSAGLGFRHGSYPRTNVGNFLGFRVARLD